MMVGVGIVIVVLAYAALAIYLTIVYRRNPCERTAPTQLSPAPVCGNVTRAALQEHAVTHQVSVAKLLGVIASPGLDPLRNEAEEGVADIPRPGIEVGSADIGVLELDVLSDRQLLDPSVDDDNLSSCLPDRSADSTGRSEVAPRLARTHGRDDQCVPAPVERERDEVRLTGTARSRDPDVDLCPQQLERVFDSLFARPRHPT